MKRIAILFITFSLTLSAAAQKNNTTEKWPTFLTQAQLPDGTKYLSAPPDTSSIAYLNDFHQYQWGKSMRGTERGQQAVFDANVTIDSIMKSFAEPFGIRITKSNAPEIYYLVERVENDASAAVRSAKNLYCRKRPYVQYREMQRRCLSKKRNCATAVLIRQVIRHADGRLRLVLAEINPANQDAILKRGLDYGESRVIAGYHYQSDVDAARLAASAAVARLHADDAFAKQMVKAKKEFARIISKH
jgi:acid phosphatase (class A)